MSTTKYFNDKRASMKGEVIGIVGMDCGVYNDATRTVRGIRPNEIARSEAWSFRERMQAENAARRSPEILRKQAENIRKQEEEKMAEKRREQDIENFYNQRNERENGKFVMKTEDNTDW
jgi:hypothetical protein